MNTENTQSVAPDVYYGTLREIAKFLNASDESDVLAFDAAFHAVDTYPLRIEAMAISLCYQGTGRISLDMEDYDIKPGTLVTIQPQNFIREIENSEDFRAHTVICSLRVTELIMPKLTDVLPLMMQHRSKPVIDLTQEEAAGITSFYNFLKQKLDGPRTPYLPQKVLSMLQAAIYDMMDIRYSRLDLSDARRSRREEIMARFLIQVCEKFREERQVGYYAKSLCITPKHLSAVVKEISGRTAGEWIDHYVVLEAKMLLLSTDLTIQEISSRLNFANQSFFGKYFKHHTGFSPSEFRSLRQQNPLEELGASSS